MRVCENFREHKESESNGESASWARLFYMRLPPFIFRLFTITLYYSQIFIV